MASKLASAAEVSRVLALALCAKVWAWGTWPANAMP